LIVFLIVSLFIASTVFYSALAQNLIPVNEDVDGTKICLKPAGVTDTDMLKTDATTTSDLYYPDLDFTNQLIQSDEHNPINSRSSGIRGTLIGPGNYQDSGFFENIMRHAIIGTEIIPHKNFYFSAGYNYQRRKELQTEAKISAVGFSWGFGINTSFMYFEFGRAMYHLAGSSNHISLIIKTDKIYNKFRK